LLITFTLGYGDVAAINIWEKFYSIVVMMLGIMEYLYSFSQMTSLIEELSPLLTKTFDSEHLQILRAVKTMNVQKFYEKIDVFISLFWPHSLKRTSFIIYGTMPEAWKKTNSFKNFPLRLSATFSYLDTRL